MALSYLSYLEQNHYLKSDKRYLFGDLLQYNDKAIPHISEQPHSEHLFIFLEMLKVFFPGGDHLFAPDPLLEIVQQE